MSIKHMSFHPFISSLHSEQLFQLLEASTFLGIQISFSTPLVYKLSIVVFLHSGKLGCWGGGWMEGSDKGHGNHQIHGLRPEAGHLFAGGHHLRSPCGGKLLCWFSLVGFVCVWVRCCVEIGVGTKLPTEQQHWGGDQHSTPHDLRLTSIPAWPWHKKDLPMHESLNQKSLPKEPAHGISQLFCANKPEIPCNSYREFLLSCNIKAKAGNDSEPTDWSIFENVEILWH